MRKADIFWCFADIAVREVDRRKLQQGFAAFATLISFRFAPKMGKVRAGHWFDCKDTGADYKLRLRSALSGFTNQATTVVAIGLRIDIDIMLGLRMQVISLSEYPTSVLEVNTWSRWRRFLNRPPAEAQKRCEAWCDLLEIRKSASKSVRLDTPKSKIFDDSRRRWDILDDLHRGNFTLRSRFSGFARGAKETFRSPHGSLVKVMMVPHFECDASDIEGISSSKSAGMPHESVDVFGAYYIDEQNQFARKGKAPLRHDEASLQELCSHGEIRLLHGRDSDTFSVRAWDGRLFLDNGGGSHHLAGAVHVAKRIRARIPLASKLYLFKLNELTVQWLLDGYHLVLLPKDLAERVLWIAKSLVGSGSNMEMPPVLGEGTLLAFPRGAQIAECLMAELLSQGHHDLGTDLRDALAVQQQFLTESTTAWAKHFSSPT